eukprot:3823904-Pyramimonas_sp.AAC.1
MSRASSRSRRSITRSCCARWLPHLRNVLPLKSDGLVRREARGLSNGFGAASVAVRSPCAAGRNPEGGSSP